VSLNSSISAADYSNISVLVAEDNLVSQNIMCKMLKKLGVEHVTVLADGLKAVESEVLNGFDPAT